MIFFLKPVIALFCAEAMLMPIHVNMEMRGKQLALALLLLVQLWLLSSSRSADKPRNSHRQYLLI
jgi:hypothetical protein